ncbi:pyridoxal phosphate-dependent decarboxylase family protein [Terricaulis sp.]|uniref:pyridoxal phosphate-dependent decarboxylase family protein n=1 Tax=Terricaulis sp. TaxID=2768686 RepID=UPI003784FA48
MTPLPEHGTPWPDLEHRMRALGARDVKWREGKTAVYVFNAGPEIEQVKKAAYAMFSEENGLGPAAFPSLAQMEREVVGFGLALMHAPAGAAGAMTSGGTDSITMAVKAARDHARAKGQKGPANIVIPYSAHPAFDKACALMDIEVRRIPLKDYLADPTAMEAAIDANTLMLVGSAPCFPFGLIDPIPELGAIAAKHGVWLHVDACVGGYFAPFAAMNGAALTAWDFALPGVMSISADLHKYGYASKGASTVLFRSEALKERMTFDAGPWPLGRMTTPTLAGTRPGGAIAAAWAVMNFLGVDGYRAKQGAVVQAREKIEAGVQRLGFRVHGAPQLGLIAFTHERADTFGLFAKMHHRGWMQGALVDPPALHLMLSPIHNEVADVYLTDLGTALADSGVAPKAANYSE